MPGTIGGLDSFEKIGVVVGETTHMGFYFAIESSRTPQIWDYVVVSSKESVDGVDRNVLVLGQIVSIVSYSPGLSEYTPYHVAEKLKDADIIEPRNLARVRVLGFTMDDRVMMPRHTIYPGTDVYMAPDEVLSSVYSYPEEEGLFVGHLITRPDVRVHLTVRGFRRHLAILAQTGAGKSYTSGVLIEELYDKGATVIVLDPHADYVFISQSPQGRRVLRRVDVFRTRESTGRYTREDIGHVETFEVRFSDLSPDEIFTVAGISDKWSNIQKAVRDVLKKLNGERPGRFGVEDLIGELESRGDNNALRALKYVEKLRGLKVFGEVTTPVGDLLRPRHVSVIDLSGLSDNVADYIAYRILSEVYHQRERGEYRYPVFILVEEAHRFIPRNGGTLSKRVVKRIAAEGRKFGVFLILVTQRPQKIDQDVLSQCNSQIIMRMTNPEDQKAVRKSAEQVSEELLEDLPGLNVGEAVIVGEITKMPVMVRIRERKTREGGADVDVVGLLKEALKESTNENPAEELERVRSEIKNLIDMGDGE